MKKLFCILLLTALFLSCSNDEDKDEFDNLANTTWESKICPVSSYMLYFDSKQECNLKYFYKSETENYEPLADYTYSYSHPTIEMFSKGSKKKVRDAIRKDKNTLVFIDPKTGEEMQIFVRN